MWNLDALLSRAKNDLLLPLPDGTADVLLWEYTLRVFETARRILRIAEVADAKPNADVVTVASLYHDAGYAAAVREGRRGVEDVLVAPADDIHREAGVALMTASIAGIVEEPTLGLAAAAIRALNMRKMQSVEACVVSDAENLNKLGVLSLWPALRRTLKTGAGVGSFVERWRRQREYRFWEARLGEAFHFEDVRLAAGARVDAMAQFFAAVQREHIAGDLTDLLCIPPSQRASPR